MAGLLNVAVAAVAAWAVPAAAAWAAERFACIGTEPFWRLDVTDERARYRPMEGAPTTFAGRLTAVANRSRSYAWRGAAAGGAGAGEGARELVAFLNRTERCSDGMSDRTYPIEVFVSLPDGTALQGCCR